MLVRSTFVSSNIIHTTHFDSHKGTWGNHDWTRRFRPYAIGEIRFYEALEQYKHLNLRTFNIHEADFVLVPITLGAVIFFGSPTDVSYAFRHLLDNEPFFKAHPEKHLYITNNERLFRGGYEDLKLFNGCCGITLDLMKRISKGILVKDFDAPYFRQYIWNHPETENGKTWQSYGETRPLFQYQWSIGYAHEASNDNYPFIDAEDYDNWSKKNITFFYRSPTAGASMYNSTQYRHALLAEGEADKLIHPPSAIGQTVRHEHWLREFSGSKYCIVIRGDNPSSRSLYAAIRMGCLPVIVSHALPYYQPIFRSLVTYDDFSISIDEGAFLSKPAESLNSAIQSLSESDLRLKVRGLSLLQRLLVLDHPKSLFVSAFVHETVVRQLDHHPYLFMGNSSSFTLNKEGSLGQDTLSLYDVAEREMMNATG
jgi:hypothetical protein